MSSNIDFKKLWQNQETPAPDTKEFFEQTKKYKRTGLAKVLFTNVLLVFTCVFIASIWYREDLEMLSTKIGIVLTLLSMVIYLLVYNQMIPLLMKVQYDKNNSAYLQQLLKIKAKQSFLQKTMLNIYFVLLSAGIFIYMLEPASKMTLSWALFSYGITLLWIAFSWFFLRPKTIKKQEAKINELINAFTSLNGQLSVDAD